MRLSFTIFCQWSKGWLIEYCSVARKRRSQINIFSAETDEKEWRQAEARAQPKGLFMEIRAGVTTNALHYIWFFFCYVLVVACFDGWKKTLRVVNKNSAKKAIVAFGSQHSFVIHFFKKIIQKEKKKHYAWSPVRNFVQRMVWSRDLQLRCAFNWLLMQAHSYMSIIIANRTHIFAYRFKEKKKQNRNTIYMKRPKNLFFCMNYLRNVSG